MSATQTALDKFLQQLGLLVGTGRDGVEQGLSTTEFWLSLLALLVDIFGPRFGWLGFLTPQVQAELAVVIVGLYTIGRSLRKKGTKIPEVPVPPK